MVWHYVAIYKTPDGRNGFFNGSCLKDLTYLREMILGRGDVILAEREADESQAVGLGRMNGGRPAIEHLMDSIGKGEDAQEGLDRFLAQIGK
jgi:hypothetical protein